MRAALTLLCLLLALPVLLVPASWLLHDGAAQGVLLHQARTVLPGYALQSLLLAAGVGFGAALLGVATAATVALFRFPGRRIWEWALLLPLAMPAYVLAYAWTDALQFSGPVQTALRSSLGLHGALWPDVRSLGGAVPLFVLCLYPYVHLLTRAALGGRALHLMEAARLLGAGPARRLLRVALPLARPAVAAGVALALMETLADYGVGAYFGLSTLSTGIVRAWLVMNDATAAAQLASLLLVLVALLLALERRARSRLRFVASRGSGAPSAPMALAGGAAVAATLVCALPVLLGFALPAGWLALAAWQEVDALPLQRFAGWAWASLRLSATAALAATLLALATGAALRFRSGHTPLAWAARLLALGYAVPGAVVAIGVLLAVGWLQQRWPAGGAVALVTGTSAGVLLAYLTRFSSVAMQAVQAGYEHIPSSIDDSARMLGTSRLRLFVRLHLPLLSRSVAAAALLVFVDVMKELPATLTLRPFGSDTLAVVAYNLARDERLAEAALPSLAIVLTGLLPVLLLARAVRS